MRRWEWLAAEATKRGWTRGAEIGVKEGQTLFYLLDTVPRLHMIGVDLWANQPAEGINGYNSWDHDEHFAAVCRRAGDYRGRLTLCCVHSVIAAKYVKDGSLDFVFIDANHAEHAVGADVMAWRPKIRAGGALCGHDARKSGVRAALDAKCPGWREVGHDQCWILDGGPE